MSEAQELSFTKKRVLYSNIPSEPNLPDSSLRQNLEERCKKLCVKPFPIAPKVNVETFTQFLFDHPELNKIHSTTLDVFESLPFRPDVAFDSMWRALEVLMMRYAKDVFHIAGKDVSTLDIMTRICNEAIGSIINHYDQIHCVMDKTIELAPESIGRFTLVRMLMDREIKVSSQFGLVSYRAKKILGEDLYNAFVESYVKNGTLSSNDHHRGARKIQRLINGTRLTFNGMDIKGLDEKSRLEFIMSVILYTSRCERYHGDFFSPFFSDRACLQTYKHWYWLLNTTIAFFWILFLKYAMYMGFKGLTEDCIAASIAYNAKEFAKL